MSHESKAQGAQRAALNAQRAALNAQRAALNAQRRRSTWSGGVAQSFDELERIDLDCWLAQSVADRLRAVWSLMEDSLSLRGQDGPAPRLQRSVGGVRPLRG